MKKIIFLLFVWALLSSCGQSQSEVDAAKQKILWDNTQTPVEVVIPEEEQTPVVEKVEEKTSQNIQIIPLSTQQVLNFDEISPESLTSGEVKITGTTADVDSIDVLFSNPTSAYPDDDYTLQTFKAWDTDFRYVASSRNQVLDFGENTYIFTAHAGSTTSQTKVVLVVPREWEEDEKKWTESNLIGTENNTTLIDLPTSSKYGEPMKLWEASFTYTQIKGLEVEKQILSEVSCDGVTEFLTEKINTWFYWNTCRDIVKEKWIKFNVIRLDGEAYVYERHYLDFKNGFYGTYELERWTWVDSDNIAEKNTLLKEQEFPSLEIVDDLMKDIINS